VLHEAVVAGVGCVKNLIDCLERMTAERVMKPNEAKAERDKMEWVGESGTCFTAHTVK
jgi:hypothetical protein